jgi:hypothetical protein
MEKAQFENRTLLDSLLFGEAVAAHYKVSKKRYRMFVAIYSGISFALSLFCFVRGYYHVSALMFANSIFMMFVFYKGYLFHAGRAYRSHKALNPSLQYDIQFFRDHFECMSSNSNRSIEYIQVSDIAETENALVFIVFDTLVVIGKDGFPDDEYGAAFGFLESVCSRATIHRLAATKRL